MPAALIAFFVLLAASAFFSASETALTALSPLRIKRLSVAYPRFRRPLEDWLTNPARLLSTILVGNTVVNLAASSLAAALAAGRWPAFEPFVSWGVWVGTTVLLVVCCEILPKIVSRVYREQVVLGTLPLLMVLARVFFVVWKPVQWLFARLGLSLEEAPLAMLSVTTTEELHHIIQEGQSEGHLPTDAGEMMKRVLVLQQRTVREIMQPAERVDSVPAHVYTGIGAQPLFVDLLMETGRSRVPVMREKAPVGYVRVQDVLLLSRRGALPPLSRLVRPAQSVSPGLLAVDLLVKFQKSGEHIAFVWENDAFLGLVTLEDVIEEIVGEVLDEYDLEQRKAMEAHATPP